MSLAYVNGLFYVILGANWCYNIYLLLRLRRDGIVHYNITTKLFYAFAGVVIVARLLFLIWIDPPYGDNKTVLCENFVDYSIMAIGILQISNLFQINERLETLSRRSTNLDRSSLNKSLRRSSPKSNFILFGMLSAVGLLFVIDTSIVYPAVKSDPVAD